MSSTYHQDIDMVTVHNSRTTIKNCMCNNTHWY